jgi:ribosomal protein S10
MSLIPLKRLNFFFSPRKKKLFSLTRAPFVFKKSKEQFIIDFYKALICLDFTSVNILFLNFLKSIIMKVYVLSRLPIKFSHNITMTSG